MGFIILIRFTDYPVVIPANSFELTMRSILSISGRFFLSAVIVILPAFNVSRKISFLDFTSGLRKVETRAEVDGEISLLNTV